MPNVEKNTLKFPRNILNCVQQLLIGSMYVSVIKLERPEAEMRCVKMEVCGKT